MPLGFLRLNERAQRPNGNINFIKPWSSATPAEQDIAREFLERIAAQCFPIMRKHYISVMALEEYPPNPEFLGRNFNAGEVIQLVLKDRGGRWLGFRAVQMVMMHELAHCKQMNHSRDFWKVRNQYADEMKELWAEKYLGEGLWGRGKNLASGRFVHDNMPDHVDIPEHLCGGTYRRARGRKRKRGTNSNDSQPTLTYAERQQRRISRKFGKHGEGTSLGEDDLVRGALERGRPSYSKPKVAQSKRGRELRAAAALARLEHAKSESRETTPDIKKEEDDSTDSDWSEDDMVDGAATAAAGIPTLTDSRGRDMVRVCGEEADCNDEARDELNDMRSAGMYQRSAQGKERIKTESLATTESGNHDPATSRQKPDEDSETASDDDDLDEPLCSSRAQTVMSGNDDAGYEKSDAAPLQTDPSPKTVTSADMSEATTWPTNTATKPSDPTVTNCAVCSLENDAGSPTCAACANVLKPGLVRNSWRCMSESCRGTAYINAGDAGRCGLCGAARPAKDKQATDSRHPVERYTAPGLVGNDVLRWD